MPLRTVFDTGAVNIAMVEGSALGGGFETALAHHFVVLAQNNARMGFPEIAFNLFPSMGGYSLVARKAGMRLAEELIWGGKSHTASGSRAAGWWISCSSPAMPIWRRALSSIPSGRSSTACARHAAGASARIATDAFQADGYYRVGLLGLHH